MVTVTAAPAMAQKIDSQTAIANVKSILASNAPDKDKQVANIAKAFKKDAKTLTAIGREYLSLRNYDKAKEYGDMAVAKNKNCGDAYILLGDVAVGKNEGGEAAVYYQQAMYMDKTNPEGYRRYAYVMATSSPEASAQALEELRKNLPDHPVDLIAAEIYDNAGKKKEAIAYYEKADRNKMKDYEFVNYLSDLFFTGDYNKCVEVGTWGAKKFPRNGAVNRLTFYSFTEKKDYDKALYYANRLFNESDSVKVLPFDLQYYGHAALGNKDYDKALEVFNKLYEHADANSDAKEDALKNMADAFIQKEDYRSAIDTYKKYKSIAKRMSATDYASYGQAHMLLGQSLSGDEKVAALKDADAVYAELAEVNPNAIEYAYYQRARVAGLLDPTSKEGLSKPYYDKVIEIITSRGDFDSVSKSRLVQAYHYNMAYYLLIKKDTPTAKSYASKILALDPDYAPAKQLMK